MKKTGYLRNEKIIHKFGKRLKKIRLEKGLSQEDLAIEAEITVTYISKMENGKVNTSLSHMEALSKALDIKIIELLNFIDD